MIGEVGKIMFKCRYCEVIFEAVSTPDWHATLVYVTTGTDMNRAVTQHPQAPHLYEIHFCDDKRRGVADMIGAFLEK